MLNADKSAETVFFYHMTAHINTMTTTLIPKSWDDLTARQRDEVIEYALNDQSIRMDLYYEEQRILDSMFESLKKKHNDLYKEFDVEWYDTVNSYRLESDWHLVLNGLPFETLNLKDVGLDGPVEVTITGFENVDEYIQPTLDNIMLEFDYDEDEILVDGDSEIYVDDDDFEYRFEDSAVGKAFLQKYADIYNKPLEEYISIVKEVVYDGVLPITEYLEAEMNENGLTAWYYVDENGNEVLEGVEW